MAGKISDQLIPQNELVVHLKQHIAQLYLRLGHSPIQAEYKTLLEAGDYASLGPAVSSILSSGQHGLVADTTQSKKRDTTHSPRDAVVYDQSKKAGLKAKKSGKNQKEE